MACGGRDSESLRSSSKVLTTKRKAVTAEFAKTTPRAQRNESFRGDAAREPKSISRPHMPQWLFVSCSCYAAPCETAIHCDRWTGTAGTSAGDFSQAIRVQHSRGYRATRQQVACVCKETGAGSWFTRLSTYCSGLRRGSGLVLRPGFNDRA